MVCNFIILMYIINIILYINIHKMYIYLSLDKWKKKSRNFWYRVVPLLSFVWKKKVKIGSNTKVTNHRNNDPYLKRMVKREKMVYVKSFRCPSSNVGDRCPHHHDQENLDVLNLIDVNIIKVLTDKSPFRIVRFPIKHD